MSPEDVKPEWVEKAAREVYAEWENEYMGDGEWPAWDSDENLARDTARTWARNILAAVLPEIQAQALREAADRLDDESGDPFREIAPLVRKNGSGLIGAVYGTAQWLRNRAARLTTTTEEATR
jgi:hypothetical protein